MHIGACHGFSIVHGAMNVIGKMEWWENMLSISEAWSGDIVDLKKKYQFKIDEEIKEYTTEQVLQIVYEYVMMHTSIKSQYRSEKLSGRDDFVAEPQHAILRGEGIIDKAYGRYLEIIKQEKNNFGNSLEILYPSSSTEIAGYINDDLLNLILTKENLANNICLVNGPGHATEIGIYKEKIYYYDPNYDKRDGKYYKEFDNVIDCIKEVKERLKGNILHIQIGNMSPLNKVDFKGISYNIELMKGNGLQFMMTNLPQHMVKDYLENVIKIYPEKEISAMVAQTINGNREEKTIYELIIEKYPELKIKLNDKIPEFKIMFDKKENERQLCNQVTADGIIAMDKYLGEKDHNKAGIKIAAEVKSGLENFKSKKLKSIEELKNIIKKGVTDSKNNNRLNQNLKKMLEETWPEEKKKVPGKKSCF